MFEKFTSSESNNFRQRYLGTFGFFKKGDQSTLVKITDVADSNLSVMKFINEEGISYALNADSDDPSIGFDFIYPKLGYHNTSIGVMLIKRIPARQYSRGICTHNTIISLEGKGVSVNFKNLKAMFDSPISAKESLEKFKTSALSSSFYINLPKETISCFDLPIGNVKQEEGPSNSLKIKLKNFNMWNTELNDALRRENIGGIVV